VLSLGDQPDIGLKRKFYSPQKCTSFQKHYVKMNQKEAKTFSVFILHEIFENSKCMDLANKVFRKKS